VRAPLHVNLVDGRTEEFDLAIADDVERWRARAADFGYQRRVRGAQVAVNGRLHTVPRPRDFDVAALVAESVYDGPRLVAVRVGWHAGEVLVQLTVYTREPHVTRMDVLRPGKMRVPRRRR
jgi:hypothetical protein